MGEKKMYFLAPEFGISPNSSITLGNIIEHPANVTRVLTSLEPPLPPEKISITREKSIAHSRSHGGKIDSKIWANFLEIVSLGAGGGGGKDTKTGYTISGIETHMFKHDPTDEEATERSKHPSVQAFMNDGLFGSQPVYMVTAIKIARDFRYTRESGSHIEGYANVAGGHGGISGGGDVDAEHHREEHDSGEAVDDIVFAFRLHVISKKDGERSALKPTFSNPRQRF